MTQVKPVVLVCGNIFDGVSDCLSGSGEILIQDGKFAEVAEEVGRPPDAEVVDLSERTVMPGFIDTHVHLTMDASDLAQQTLDSAATKALKGLNLAREYMGYGFTTLRDLGSIDPQFPTVDLRDALNAGLVDGPRLVVAAHIICSSGGTAMCAASTGPAGTCRSRTPRTASPGSGNWCAGSTRSGATGSRRPTPAATSARATTRRG
jgi:imidazolonepropionase-like amidohydrolase